MGQQRAWWGGLRVGRGPSGQNEARAGAGGRGGEQALGQECARALCEWAAVLCEWAVDSFRKHKPPPHTPRPPPQSPTKLTIARKYSGTRRHHPGRPPPHARPHQTMMVGGQKLTPPCASQHRMPFGTGWCNWPLRPPRPRPPPQPVMKSHRPWCLPYQRLTDAQPHDSRSVSPTTPSGAYCQGMVGVRVGSHHTERCESGGEVVRVRPHEWCESGVGFGVRVWDRVVVSVW